ncbi:UNVERIFIED_CONTAM: hypothetical protein DES50_101245 [Williamsia faeni]
MSASASSYPSLSVDATGRGIMSHTGAVALLRSAQVGGLDSTVVNVVTVAETVGTVRSWQQFSILLFRRR